MIKKDLKMINKYKMVSYNIGKKNTFQIFNSLSIIWIWLDTYKGIRIQI